MNEDLFGLDAINSKQAQTPSQSLRVEKSKQNKADQLAFRFETLLSPSPNTSSRYPTLLTRIPIFEPIKDRKKADTSGWGMSSGGDNYETGELRVQRFGPGLSIYDEDTLIAILQIAAARRLRGSRTLIQQHLKDKIDIEGDPDVVEEVFFGCITSYKINDYLGRGTGGDQLKQCFASIDRLSLTTLRFFNDAKGQLGTTKFFELIRDYEVAGDIYVKINATMVTLLKEYTEIDLTIRKTLTDTGKSVHRYLSGQENKFSISLVNLMTEIRYGGEIKDFKRSLLGRKATTKTKSETGQLTILKDCGWLDYFEISGTGRKSPFVLHVIRNSRTNF